MLLLFYSFEKLLLPLKLFAFTELVCEVANFWPLILDVWESKYPILSASVIGSNFGYMTQSGRIRTLCYNIYILVTQVFSSFLFSSVHSIMSDSLWPHGLQHTRLPCPSLTPGTCSNSCLSQWCHPTISSSVVPFSSCLQFFPASGSFPMSPFFVSGGQSIGQLQHQSFQWIFRTDLL